MRDNIKKKNAVEPEKIPLGIIHSAADVGAWIRFVRKSQHITLVEAAALIGVGVRFLLELEHGKPTASLGKALLVLDRMGLEVVIRRRRGDRSNER